MAKVAVFRTETAEGTLAQAAAFLLDDPAVAGQIGAAVVERLNAAAPGDSISYTAIVYDLSNPPA